MITSIGLELGVCKNVIKGHIKDIGRLIAGLA